MFYYDKLKSLMDLRGISAAQLSRETGISQTLFTQWKQGRQSPSVEYAERIANYFDVPIDYLLGTGLYQKEELIQENWDLFIRALRNVKLVGFPEPFTDIVSTFLQYADDLPIYTKIEFLQLFLKDINCDEENNQLTFEWRFK